MRPPPAIIFTDLDGTLLDHHDYSFAAAAPALQALQARGIPVILTTSKTLAEVREINQALQNPQPAIVENGCALCFPLDRDYPFELGQHEQIDDYAVIRFPPAYPEIQDFIAQQRARHHWQLRGFDDMSPRQVAEATGLSTHQSVNAKRRLGSEPFVWLDSEDRLRRFIAAAVGAGLHITRGGRFWHLMGRSSKAQALKEMQALFVGPGKASPRVIALGDSENDRGMLEYADIAVIIKRHDATHLDCRGKQQTLLTQHPGPVGWNAAVLQILTELGSQNPPTPGD